MFTAVALCYHLESLKDPLEEDVVRIVDLRLFCDVLDFHLGLLLLLLPLLLLLLLLLPFVTTLLLLLLLRLLLLLLSPLLFAALLAVPALAVFLERRFYSVVTSSFLC